MEKMNFKCRMFLLLAVGISLWSACDDKEDTDAVNNLPPGTEYVKQGNQCLNVVYYIRKDGDMREEWHQRISGIMLEQQDWFRQQMDLCGYEGKTFQLSVNKDNPHYVKVFVVQGEVDSIANKGAEVLCQEVENYFSQHAEEVMSRFTLIFAPGVGISDINTRTTDYYCVINTDIFSNDENEMLKYHGVIANRLGNLFLLPESSEPVNDAHFSLMNSDKIGFWTWNAIRLKKPDALWLNWHPLFNPQSQGYINGQPEVVVDRAEFDYANGRINVACEFTADQNVVGVVVVNDPWTYPDREDDILDKNYTIGDAIPYATEDLNPNGSHYKFTLSIPWDDMPATYKVSGTDRSVREAEIRFRFILENGMTVPFMVQPKGDIKSGYRYPYAIRDNVPDFSTEVNVEVQPDDNTDQE